nr:MAG TPA: hypothetical protein [Caudoviricetes sp.]
MLLVQKYAYGDKVYIIYKFNRQIGIYIIISCYAVFGML